MTDPICITGMHRSGTSMIARAVTELGVWFGAAEDLVPGAPDNPDGFFEHQRMVAASNEFLAALGGGWDCPPELGQDWRSDDRLASGRRIASTTVAELSRERPWGWKDPRVALTLPLWLDLVPDAAIVVCVRNPLEVAASLRARNGCSLAFGLQLWARYLDTALEATEGRPRILTHYDAWFTDPGREVARLVEFAGIPTDVDRCQTAEAVPARHARHSRFDARSLSQAGVHPSVRELYRALCDEADWLDGATTSAIAGARSTAPAPHATGTGVGTVDVAAVDIGLARYEVSKRNGRVSQLERRVAELESELRATHAQAQAHARTVRTDDLAVLHSTVYDLQLMVGMLTARVTNGIDRETTDRDIAYLGMIRELRSDVQRLVAPDADVLVFSERDTALVDLHGRRVKHFPVGPLQGHPGPHPIDDTALGAHLVACHAAGATHIVVPPTSAWWLTAYPAFAERLTQMSRSVHRGTLGACIHELEGSRIPDRWPTTVEALAWVHRQVRQDASVLDWTQSGAGVTGSFETLDPGHALPYLDSSIDVVVVDALDTLRHDEARRVASAGVLLASPDGTMWSPSAAAPTIDIDIVVLATTVANPAHYLSALMSGLPPMRAGRLIVAVPERSAAAWRGIDDRFDIVEIQTSEGAGEALRRIVRGLSTDLVAIVDGGTVPLEGWLPTLCATFGRGEHVGLVAARRLCLSGEPVADELLCTPAGLSDRVSSQSDVTLRIGLAPSGAFLTRTSLLAAGTGLDEDYRTLRFAVAAYCRAIGASGLDVLVQPEARTIELEWAGRFDEAEAQDRLRFDATRAAAP